MGRAVQSTFASKLAEGKARLDFRRPENREFGLAVCRYIDSLKLRATWRTVYEWAKLLFSLDPANDPYCMVLVLDQYAIRANQHQQLIDLVDTDQLVNNLSWLPRDERDVFFNLPCTLPLAFLHTSKPDVAQLRLFEAMERYPWVFHALFKELGIEPIPPSIWGKQPPDQSNDLLAKLYVSRAKDLWNTPEATSLLAAVGPQAQPLKDSLNPAFKGTNIFTQHEAPMRHVILTENREFISKLPVRPDGDQLKASDPMPPADNLQSYDAEPPPPGPQRGILQELGLQGDDRAQLMEAMRRLQEEGGLRNMDLERELGLDDGEEHGWDEEPENQEIE
jgi:Transcriptional repressor TCF25